jgi:hypothetical protein
MAAPQIPLNQILAAIDQKDRDFYNNLSDELKKKFSPYMMLKYSASVVGSKHPKITAAEMENYYILSTNGVANRHMFDLADKTHPEHDHPQLQWLLFTTISPNAGNQYHTWLKPKPKATGPVRKQLAELYPQMKDNDLDVLSTLVTKKELNKYIKDHGEK